MGKKVPKPKKGAKAYHKPGGNARVDYGNAGQSEESPAHEAKESKSFERMEHAGGMVPSGELHSAQNAPHKMSIADMYAAPDPTHHLHALAEHHAQETAKYEGMGAEHRAMADHHRGMMHAMHDQIRAGAGRSQQEAAHSATLAGGHPASPSATAHYGAPSPLAQAKATIKKHPKGGMKF